MAINGDGLVGFTIKITKKPTITARHRGASVGQTIKCMSHSEWAPNETCCSWNMVDDAVFSASARHVTLFLIIFFYIFCAVFLHNLPVNKPLTSNTFTTISLMITMGYTVR